jgi:hypothetical protein
VPSTSPTPAPLAGVRAVHLLRAAGNALNLTTGLGLVVALAGRARVRRGPQVLLVAEGYRLPVPRAGAFTIGGIVIVPRGTLAGVEAGHPGTLQHEAVHSWQYFWCLGLPFLPLYALASGWSWLRRGDPASGNWFERNAGLARGGYLEAPVTNAGLRAIGRALHLT